MAKTSIVVLGDVHVGSKLAVMPLMAKIGQPLPTDDDDAEGGVYHATKAQRTLLEAWKECATVWKRPDIMIINGELIDGPNPKQPSEVWTTNLYDQMKAAKQLVDMYDAKKTYLTRGSDYHVTVNDQQFEEYLGQMLGAEKVGGKFAPTELNFEVQGKYFNAAHHIGTSTATWYRSVEYGALSPIMDSNGHIKIASIGEYVDSYLDEGYDFSKDRILSFNKAGEVTFSPIRMPLRHLSTDARYNIKTRYGRQLVLTGGHGLFTSAENAVSSRASASSQQLQTQIKVINVDSLAVKDEVLIPISMPESPSQILSFDILDILWNEGLDDKIVVVMTQELRTMVSERRTLLNGASAPYTALKNGRITIALLKRLGITPQMVQQNVKLASQAHFVETPRTIKFTEDFARILGYYIAEGHINGPSIVFSFGRTDDIDEKTFVEDLQRCFEAVFSIHGDISEYTNRGTGHYFEFSVYSSIIRHFFERFLGFDHKRANTKRLPWVMFNTTRENRKAYLLAHMAGDGWYNDQIDTVNISTTSRGLALDLMYLYLQEGIVASIYKGRPSPSAFGKAPHYEVWYHINDKGAKRRYHRPLNSSLAFTDVRDVQQVEADLEHPFVYDFSIGEPDNTDNFVSNGIACHNTTPIAKEMVAMLLAASHRYNSDVMIRSHIHFHVVVAFSRQIGVTTPCWKLQDWYVMKKSIGASTPDIGAMRFTVEDGEVDWQVKTFKFAELKPPLIKVGEK